MWKIFLFIISILSFFSISTTTKANDWYLEELLNINYWVEEFKLKLENLDDIYFNDAKTREIYENFKKVDLVLKNEFINKYKAWDFDYNKTNSLINNYNYFIFHSNKFFYYTKLRESRIDKEVNDAILSNYTYLRTYYKRVKFIIARNY